MSDMSNMPVAADDLYPAMDTNDAIIDDGGEGDMGNDIADLMLTVLSDGVDHPELWPQIPGFVEAIPNLQDIFYERLAVESDIGARQSLVILLGMCGAALGHAELMLEQLEQLGVSNSQSALVQGAIFHIQGLLDPENPRYTLEGKVCEAPFVQLDVLERTSHLCCASWLNMSVGDMSNGQWEDVWNSDEAQMVRESVHDGSYRYCNKGACPRIQGNDLTPATKLVEQSTFWKDILEQAQTVVPQGPEVVNLAYDRTCNLSCPSCRVERFAADNAMREAFDKMQQNAILPMLKSAKTVFVTGSGDPFASKNFRRLMEQLTPEDYPELGFQIMTNGMLFNHTQWNNFPALHNRVRLLKISIDASTGPTHELLRRGARWDVMLENMAFAGTLLEQGLIDRYELVFTVQQDNYLEMGDAVTLAKSVNANAIYFARITNWGTFTDAEYAHKAVFLNMHPEHDAFMEAMQDPRLLDPIVQLGDLKAFL